MIPAVFRRMASTARRRYKGSIIGKFTSEETSIYNDYTAAGVEVPTRVAVRRLLPWLAAVVASISALWWDQPWVVLYAFLMVVFAIALAGTLLALTVLGIGTHLAWMRGFAEARDWYGNERTEIGSDVNKIANMHTALAASIAYVGFASAIGLTAAALGYAMPLLFSPILFAIAVWAFTALVLVSITTLHRMLMWTQAGTIRMCTANFGPDDASFDDAASSAAMAEPETGTD